MSVERVVYVDALGKAHDARTLERPREGEPTLLLLKLGRSITTVRVRHSDAGEPATWHRPPKPS